MTQTRIQITKDGPLLVHGDVLVEDETGRPVAGPKAGVIALCRCGGSVTKPFCDGTHSKIGFRGAAEAVTEAEDGAV